MYIGILTQAFQPAFRIQGSAAAITSSKDTGDIGHSVLNWHDVADFIHLDDTLEEVGIWLVSNCQEKTLNWQDTLCACFHVAQQHTFNGILAQDLDHL